MNNDTEYFRAGIDSKTTKNFLNMLKVKIEYYQEETKQLETLLQKLQILDEQLNMPQGCTDLVEKLMHIQDSCNTRELSSNAIALSYAQRLREQNNYSSRLKMCLKLYMTLNEALEKKIQHYRSFYDQQQNKILLREASTKNEIRMMQNKINKYELELAKCEKKFPWLKNSDYNLPNISREINLLVEARKIKEDLQKELDAYHGLKPDLQEASAQLSQMKREYEELNNQLMTK